MLKELTKTDWLRILDLPAARLPDVLLLRGTRNFRHQYQARRAYPGGASMANPVDALVLDLLEWIGPGARPYREVMDAWRTSCPRLPVWEEANERGFLERRHSPG